MGPVQSKQAQIFYSCSASFFIESAPPPHNHDQVIGLVQVTHMLWLVFYEKMSSCQSVHYSKLSVLTASSHCKYYANNFANRVIITLPAQQDYSHLQTNNKLFQQKIFNSWLQIENSLFDHTHVSALDGISFLSIQRVWQPGGSSSLEYHSKHSTFLCIFGIKLNQKLSLECQCRILFLCYILSQSTKVKTFYFNAC